jgi:hypothetical protein
MSGSEEEKERKRDKIGEFMYALFIPTKNTFPWTPRYTSLLPGDSLYADHLHVGRRT